MLRAVEARTRDLIEASMKLGEAIYKAQEESKESDVSIDPDAEPVDPGADDVVDAEFEELEDKKS